MATKQSDQYVLLSDVSELLVSQIVRAVLAGIDADAAQGSRVKSVNVGAENAPVGTATPTVVLAGGTVTSPEDSFSDGDVSGLHFDGRGRLLANVVSCLDGALQVQHVERTTALAASETFVSTARDCANFESVSVSIYLERGATDAGVTVTVEHSHDGTTYRTVEQIPVELTATNSTFKLDRVYSVTRRYYRVSLANSAASALSATDLIVTRKLVS